MRLSLTTQVWIARVILLTFILGVILMEIGALVALAAGPKTTDGGMLAAIGGMMAADAGVTLICIGMAQA